MSFSIRKYGEPEPFIPTKKQKRSRPYSQNRTRTETVNSSSVNNPDMQSCQDSAKEILEPDQSDIEQRIEENTQEPTSSEIITFHIEEIESYKRQIIQGRYLMPLNNERTAYALAGFRNGKIKITDVLIIQRKIVSITDTEESLPFDCCSCNPYRCKLWRNIGNSCSDQSDLDFGIEHSTCIHIKAAVEIMDILGDTYNNYESDHQYFKEKTEIFQLDWDESTFCIVKHLSSWVEYILIRYEYLPIGQYRCLDYGCKHIKDCQHLTILTMHALESEEFSEILKRVTHKEVKTESRYIHGCLSKKPIPFNFQGKIDLSPPSEIKLSQDRDCNCSLSKYSEDDDLLCILYMYDSSHSITVPSSTCVECGLNQRVDGYEYHFINMGEYLISYHVLFAYMRQFLLNGTTMSTFYKEWCFLHINDVLFSSKMTYEKFQSAWYAFIGLLDINIDDGFKCPKCKENPEIVIMDGVSVSPQKKFIPWSQLEIIEHKGETLEGSLLERAVIREGHIRKLLSKYTKDTISPEEYKTLTTNTVFKPLCVLLQHIEKETPYDEKSPKCPDFLKKLLSCVSSTFPVSSYMEKRGAQAYLLELQLGHISPRTLEDLQKSNALLASIHNCLDAPLIDFIQSLLNLVENDSTVHSIPMCSDMCSCAKEELSYFPNNKQLCHRGNYTLDTKRFNPCQNRSTGKHSYHHQLKEKKGPLCKKKGRSHASLAPGLFTLSCSHGVCYGYQIMDSCEGPNVPFTIFRTRFKEAPRVIIYDNACNLSHYANNRDPGFFKRSQFLVDRLHWKNHTGCPSSFNISIYPQFREINSQISEQQNSRLVKLKPMLSYMNLTNFKKHLSLYMWFQNQLACVRSGLESSNYLQQYYSLTKRLK